MAQYGLLGKWLSNKRVWEISCILPYIKLKRCQIGFCLDPVHAIRGLWEQSVSRTEAVRADWNQSVQHLSELKAEVRPFLYSRAKEWKSSQSWGVSSVLRFTFMHWRRKWQPTPVFLPGESQGRGAWWAAVYGVTQSWTRLKWLSSSSSVLRTKYKQRTPSFVVQTESHWFFSKAIKCCFSFQQKRGEKKGVEKYRLKTQTAKRKGNVKRHNKRETRKCAFLYTSAGI